MFYNTLVSELLFPFQLLRVCCSYGVDYSLPPCLPNFLSVFFDVYFSFSLALITGTCLRLLRSQLWVRAGKFLFNVNILSFSLKPSSVPTCYVNLTTPTLQPKCVLHEEDQRLSRWMTLFSFCPHNTLLYLWDKKHCPHCLLGVVLIQGPGLESKSKNHIGSCTLCCFQKLNIIL